jgi:hypothetical protein
VTPPPSSAAKPGWWPAICVIRRAADGAGWLAMVPLNLGALLTVMFLSGSFRAWRHRRNAPERPGHKGTK